MVQLMTVSAALAEIAEGEALLDRAAEEHDRKMSDEADRRLQAADAAFAVAVPQSVGEAVAKLRCAADNADFLTEDESGHLSGLVSAMIRGAVLAAIAHLQSTPSDALAAARELRRALDVYHGAGIDLTYLESHIRSTLAGIARPRLIAVNRA
jgi:hypothetical protein